MAFRLTSLAVVARSQGPNIPWPSVATIWSQAGLKNGLSVFVANHLPLGWVKNRRHNVRVSVRPRLRNAGERCVALFFAFNPNIPRCDMSSSANFSPVQFHGQTLFVLSHHGQPFTPMKPIVEGMGMAWQPQHAKIRTNASRWSITNIVTVAEDGKSREVVCMPLRKLPGWLMTINPRKVAPAIRETVTLYQNECDDALWDFWTKGEAGNKRKAAPKALPAPAPRNTLDDYKALYSSLPGSPKYFLDILTEYANAHDVLARKLEEVKTEATKPFRVGRKSMVQTYFDASMSPMYSLFDNAEKTLHLSYCQMFDALHGCRNIWLLLHKG